MKKRIFYSILMTLLLVTGCYKDEFGQIQKEIKNLQDSQIAPLEQQLQAIEKSHSELNILSDELREYVALLEEASKELEGNIGKINEKIQDLRQALNDKNVKEKGEVLARLENAKTYLEGQLSTMKSTVDVLKEKYDGIQSQMDAMDALLADKYATKDWVSGTFATIEQQNALIAEVEAVKVLANELNATALKIESDVKTYMAELRESTLGTVDSSISAQIGELTTAYESAIGTVVANVTAAFNSEIESAINTSESGIMSWVDEALKDYLTTAEAEAKLAFYKGCIGAVPDGESLQSQIDDLGALIDGIKPEIEAAYKEAIKKAIEESEGKLTKELTGEIESIKLNELKPLTDGVSALGDDVTKLWEYLGKLEKRINDLESQVDAINTTLAVILGETAPTLEEYISALDDELRGNDDARTAYLKNLVDALRYAVDGKDNDKSLQRCIEDIKTLLGTLPAGETSIVEWVQSSKTAIDLQLKSYATIAYVDGLRHEIDSATTDHSNRLDIISGRLGSAIEDSKTTICSWISEALTGYMRGAEFDARLQTLVGTYERLFSEGDQGLQNQINTLSYSVKSAIAELQEAYKTKIDTCITEYNSYVVKTVDAKYEEVKDTLDADSTKFDALEATIDGMKNDVKALNVSIGSLRKIVVSLDTFVYKGGYTSLKAIVRDFDAKLKALTGIYADLKAFNAANEAVNKVGGYKESIEKLAGFKTRLEDAEAAITNYKNLAKDFDLDGKTLKDQFDALNDELSALKTAVFGGASLRSQLEAIEAKDTELATAIDGLNSTLLSRLKSYTSIAFRPEGQNSDGYASFLFNGKDFTSTIMFDVRPKELSEAIAKVATIKYVNSPTRALADMYDAKATVTSPDKGVLKAVVTLPGEAKATISTGVSMALFAQGNGFDFVSDFIPVSGDRMFPDKRIINVGGTGATDLKVKVYYPTGSGNINTPGGGGWFTVSKINNSPSSADFGMSYTEYKIDVNVSKSTNERSSVLTFSVGRGSNTLSCTVEIIQAPREKQDFLLFAPADGKIKFSWKGELIDTLTGNPYSPAKTSQDIDVITSDGLSDWTVKTAEDTQWATVTQKDNKAILKVGAGTGNANYNQTGADRTGKIVFSNATSTLDTTYTFIQFPRPQQRLVFNPDTTVGLSFGHGKTEKSNGQKTFTVKALDGEYDEYGWTDSKGDYNWINYEVSKNGDPRTVTVWTDANPDTTARTGYISFKTKTGMNDTTYLYPIHQQAAPKQMFIFSPREYLGQNCYIGEDGLIHIGYRGGSDMYIYVKGDPIDDWTMTVNDAGTDNWLSGSGRSEARYAPAGFSYYIQITAKENEGETDRDASIRITCDGKDYDYKVIQDHKTADINNFDPASGKIEFYWDGRVIGDDGKPTSATYKDIEVTTGNGSYGWTVAETPDIPWAKVEKRTGLVSANVRVSEVEEYKNTEEDRTGTLTFTSETQKTYSYTFTQLKAAQTTATVTIGGNEVEKLIISGNGKQYKLSDSDTQWKNITTSEVDGVSGSFFLAKVETDDGTEWSVALDPTKTSEGWGIAATKVYYRSSIISSGDYRLGLSNYGTNQTDSPRYAEIVISNGLGEICRIPVVQEVRPAQSFSFDPALTFPDFKAGTITTTVTPDPSLKNDEWNVTDTNEPIDGWLTVKRDKDQKGFWPVTWEEPANRIILTATKNNSTEPREAELVITYEGGSAKYTVTQPGREAQTFTNFNPASGSVKFSWDGKVLGSDGKPTSSTTQDITVTTSDGLNDWSVETTNTSWATVEHRTGQNANKARVSVQENKDKSERTGKLTFTSETGVTETYTFSQEANPGLSVSVSPDYVEIIRDYNSGNSSKRKYRTSPNGEWNNVPNVSGTRKITLTVETIGGGPSDWDIEYRNPDWASVTRDNGVIYIKPENVRNDKVQQKDSIIFKDKAGNLLTTYYYYKETRPGYSFTNGVSDKEYNYDVTNDSFNVSTSDGSTDWYIKVFDEDGTTERTTDSGYWLKAEKQGTSVKLTMSANDGNSDKVAKIRFFTFNSAATITVTQKARPAQTFTDPTEGQVFEYEFIEQTNKSITVTTSDGLNDWKLGDVTLNEGSGWLTVSKKDDGSGLNVNINANDGSERTATVKLLPFDEAASGARTFTIQQKAHEEAITVSFNETSWNPGWKGGSTTVGVTPSVAGYTDWNVEVSSDGAGWLTATKNAGSTGVDLVAAKQPNKGSVRRSATVSFTNGQGTNTITVTQDARGAQTISSVLPSSFIFSANGTKYSTDGTNWNNAPATVTVATDDEETDWTVASSTWTPAPSKDGANLSFASPSAVTTWLDNKPSGTTIVTSYDGGSSQNITITQNRPLTVIGVNNEVSKSFEANRIGMFTGSLAIDVDCLSDSDVSVSTNLSYTNASASASYSKEESKVTITFTISGSGITAGWSTAIKNEGTFEVIIKNNEGDTKTVTVSFSQPRKSSTVTLKVSKIK